MRARTGALVGLIVGLWGAAASGGLRAAPAPSPESLEFRGALHPDLTPNVRLGFTTGPPLLLAGERERASLPTPVATDDQVYVARGGPSRAVWLAFVRPRQGVGWVYVDVDGDSTLRETERFALDPRAGELMGLQLEGTTVVRTPLSVGVIRSDAVRFQIGWSQDAAGTREPVLMRSSFALVEGVVDVDGRSTLVWSQFDRASSRSDPEHGWVGMDCDGDGKIDASANSVEFLRAQGAPVLFRVGNRTVSIKSIDAMTGVLVLRTHPDVAYRRVNLRVGQSIPDFAFEDLEGRPRRLGELRGKLVLLDFWATWCSSCLKDQAALKVAYERRRAHGLEVLGINMDEDPAQARAFVEKSGLTWLQASSVGMEGLFNVNSYPTYVLIDGDGVIVVADSAALRGDALEATLDRVLPKPPESR